MSLPMNVRYAARLMSRKPLFMAAMVLTLGICRGKGSVQPLRPTFRGLVKQNCSCDCGVQ